MSHPRHHDLLLTSQCLDANHCTANQQTLSNGTHTHTDSSQDRSSWSSCAVLADHNTNIVISLHITIIICPSIIICGEWQIMLC